MLPKPLQAPHSPVWMAASSVPAIEWGSEPGPLDPDGPALVFADLIKKRRYHAAKLEEAGYSNAGRTIPMARLIAVQETAEKARDVARSVAEWTVASYAGRKHTRNVRQEMRSYGGKDPVDYYPVRR